MSFRPFLAFTPLLTPKIKIWKKCKNYCRYYPFTHIHHKSRSYDVWFLRYQAQQTEFFVILGYFLPFYPHNNPENQKFEKMKKPSWDIFMLHMSKIIWCMIPEIWNATDKIFLILDQFLSFNRFPPLNNPKNQNFENLKKKP